MVNSRRVERRMRGGSVSQGYIAGITVGIMVIREFLIVMILHVVERCTITMTVRIVMTVAVAMATGQADVTRITVDITMVTHQAVLLKGIHIREDDNHLPAWRDIIVTSTDLRGKTRKDLNMIEGSDLVHQEGRKRNIVTITVAHVVILQ